MTHFINLDWEYVFDFLASVGFFGWIVQLIKNYYTNHQQRKKLEDQLPQIIDAIHEIQGTVEQLKKGETEDLHVELDELAHQIEKQGYQTEQQYNRLTQIYNTYHTLGGNGSGTKLYEQVSKLPIRSKEN
ncbi:hypothetical protein F5ESL0236_07885 [Lactobacillus sp. ESL0236]|nr:hypothetical protein F5ESL0237_07960 [Lactobacillus sp. ESL0237]RMC42594.1 hypothetical protein F5ESL0234_07865 [Lactobacillus sp. ESL0234]RMC43258.1 hypothetical protein F5ESL0236_07885 [Lactobacillus sp. ESL0236]